MSDKLEDFLETAKMYIGIIFAMLLCLDVILSVAMYEKYGIIFGYNNLLDITIEVLFILITVLFLTFVVLTIILKVHQGDMYISIGDMVDTVISFLFPVDAKSKKEISQILSRMGNKDSIISTELWKKATKGINIWNLVKSIFAYVFGISILYVVIKGWLDMDDQRLLMTVLGGLFIIVLFFWGTAWAFGVKKRPDDLLDYLILHELKFEELNRDFSQAYKYNSQIYGGEKYIFINANKGMQVAAIEDITECNVMRMGGNSYRRLFLPYYVLSISTSSGSIMKYGIHPVPFYKLRDSLNITIADETENEEG